MKINCKVSQGISKFCLGKVLQIHQFQEQITEKSLIILVLEEIEALRGYKLQEKKKTGHFPTLIHIHMHTYTCTHTHMHMYAHTCAYMHSIYHDNCLILQRRKSKLMENNYLLGSQNEFGADLDLERRFSNSQECFLYKITLCLWSI